MAEGNIETIGGLIKSETLTDTTSSAGIFYTNIPNNRLILFAKCTNNCLSYLDYGGRCFVIYTVGTDTLVLVKNTKVTVTYYYIEIGI